MYNQNETKLFGYNNNNGTFTLNICDGQNISSENDSIELDSRFSTKRFHFNGHMASFHGLAKC